MFGTKRMKKKSEKIASNPSIFYNLFVGEFVQMTTNIIFKQHSQNEEEVVTKEAPIGHIGFFLDEDDVYYYLGDDPLSISQAINKSQVIHVEVISLPNPLEQILDDMDDPGEGGMN